MLIWYTNWAIVPTCASDNPHPQNINMYNPWYTPLSTEDVEEASAAVISQKADPQLLKVRRQVTPVCGECPRTSTHPCFAQVTQKLHQDQKQFLVSQRNSSKPVMRAAEATKAKDGQLCLVSVMFAKHKADMLHGCAPTIDMQHALGMVGWYASTWIDTKAHQPTTGRLKSCMRILYT